MATKLGSKLSFEDFVRVSTNTALEVVRENQKAGGFKVPPRFWVGILIDYGPNGPLGGGERRTMAASIAISNAWRRGRSPARSRAGRRRRTARGRG